MTPSAGDQAGAQPGVGLAGLGGQFHRREQANPGPHLADQRVVGQRRELAGQHRLQLGHPAEELLALE